MNKPTTLNEVGIFADLTATETKHVAEILHRRELSKEEVLFHEGDEGQELFIVESGRLGISVKAQDGSDLDITEFGPGDFFGEMSIFEQEPRSATCYTKSASVLLSLHETDLVALIERRPQLAMKIMHRMLTITRDRLDHTGSFLTEMVQWGEAARKRSITDELTGFYNRRYLDESLPSLVKKALDNANPICMCMLDLDHFRLINEEISHAVGDQVLERSVAVFREALKDTDIAIRYGGDEFVIIMPDTELRDAEVRAGAIRSGIESLDVLDGFDISIKNVTTSVGLACLPKHADDAPSLAAAADSALYGAKEGGRNRVTTYTEEDS